ncbi:MAG: hypothetical protein IT431_01540 [Phycisphaerales bacterium]|nr:hypothetical protein [Phycisphaerales bacterium]
MSRAGPTPQGQDRAPRVRAVVWRSPQSPFPADLAGALGRQLIDWEESTGPFDAFSRLLTMPGRGSGGPGRVLLLVEPQTLAGGDELRRALERFDPATVCWGYRAGSHPRLAPLPPLDRPAEPEVVVRSIPKPSNGRHLRLTGVGPEAAISTPVGDESKHAPPNDGGTSEPEPPRSVLTPEELEMLLADDRE